jgi:small nuclear ribonucleoprotein (snRNP)-like protein
MGFDKRHHFRKRHTQPPAHFRRTASVQDLVHPELTGSETAYLKSLVDSRAKVTVVLKDGERLHGRIRYYDQHCFSVGLSAKGPKIFLRKASVSYISEE